MTNSQSNQRAPIQRNLTPQNVMQDREDDEDMDTEPTPFTQSKNHFSYVLKIKILYFLNYFFNIDPDNTFY